LALAEEELAPACCGADDAPDVAPECCVPLPFCVAPEELLPLAFPLGCGGVGEGLPDALESPLLASVPEAPADPVGAAAVCCWAGAELAGAGGGKLAGLGALASSSAANGLVSIWPWADAAAASEDDETAVEALGAKLDTLGTVGDSGSDNNNDCLLATGRPASLEDKILYISTC
jgi:hypothetical protein